MLVPKPPTGPFGWTFWPSVLAIWGPGGVSDAHAHHAIQIMVAREGTLEVRLDGQPAQQVAGVITGADALHGIDAKGRRIVLVFVEPESESGGRITARLARAGAAATPLEDDERRRHVQLVEASGQDNEAAARRIVDALAGDGMTTGRGRVHPGVRRVLKHLDRSAPDADTTVPALARIARLSEGRFVHAFTESVGISLRAYLLWRKVQRAALGLQGDGTLAAVAQQAGFADAAHMTRTFRSTFGVAPSVLRGFVALSGSP